jgi:hypothetical protein
MTPLARPTASRSLGQAAFAADTCTEISWAGVELSQRQCPQAKNHVDKAAQKLSTAPSQGGDLRFLSQLNAFRKSFEATCPQQ